MGLERRTTRLRRALPVDRVVGLTASEAEVLLAEAVQDPDRDWLLEEVEGGHWVSYGIARGPVARQAWLDYRVD